MNKKYNGWKNYPTWNVSLWLNNDEGSYHELMRLLDRYPDNDQAAEAIREWVTECSPLADATGMYADILDWVLQIVDWYEIAEDNREEEEEAWTQLS